MNWKTLASFGYKLSHPLVWPVNLGSAQDLLARMVDKYNQDAEIRYATAHISEGLDEAEQWLVNGLMAKRGRVLDVGCGVGREAIALQRVGYEVVGIDIAARVIEEAQRNAAACGLAIPFFVCAAHDVNGQWNRFEYVLTSSGFYTLLPTRALRIQTLRRLASALKPHGMLFLSAPWKMSTDRVGPRAQFVDGLRRFNRQIQGAAFHTEPGDQLCGFISPVSNPQQRVFVHLFPTRRAIEDEIREAGLTCASDSTHFVWPLRPSHA